MPESIIQIKSLAISEAGLVFDPSTGAISTANPTGVAVLRLLAAGTGIDEIVDSVSHEYHADRDVVQKDLMDFLTLLEKEGLIHD